MVVHDRAGHTTQGLKIGNDVYTFDGKRIGTLGDSTNEHLRVHVRWGRDYWLSRELVHDCTPGRVTLHITSDVVDNYTTRRPKAPDAQREDTGQTLQDPGSMPD